MNINEILERHRQAGLQHEPKKYIDLRMEGANLYGKLLDIVEKENEKGTSFLYKFEVKTGEARVLSAERDDTLQPLKEGEIVWFFGTALLDYALKDRQDQWVSIIYKGKEPFKKGKKTFQTHHFIVIGNDNETE